MNEEIMKLRSLFPFSKCCRNKKFDRKDIDLLIVLSSLEDKDGKAEDDGDDWEGMIKGLKLHLNAKFQNIYRS